MSENLPASRGILPTTAQPLIVELSCPLDPVIDGHEIVEAGISVADHLKRYDLVSVPKLVVFNTQPLLEEDWEHTILQNGDQLTLISEPGELFTILFFIGVGISLLVSAYALYTILTMDSPDPGEGNNSPNYSVGYRGNQRRPGQPIPVVYGEMKVFPDYSGKYATFIDNEQWLYQIFDITMGEIEPILPEDLFYEDTPLTAFDEYLIEHVPPGVPSELFPNHVHISSEVNNIEMTQNLVWTIAYVTNPVATQVTTIVFDWALPNGYYRVDDKGRKKSRRFHIYFSWRQIDDNGDPVGEWQEIHYTSRNGIYKYTFRGSRVVEVPPGRYEARMKRSPRKYNDANYSNSMAWVGLRAFSPSTIVTETTRLAVAIRASERLGNASLSKLSIVARRKISIWNGADWSQPTHTKLAAWAFADVCRADYGAKLEDKYVDLDKLLELAGTGVEFNGVFDSKETVWTALNDITRPYNGRAIQKPGGIYSIKRDLPDQIPVMMFTMRNIVADSFGVQQTLPVSETVNFVRVTFKNALEDYRETSIDCVPVGVTPIDPYEVRLRGVTDAKHAYDIGIRMARESLYRRKRIVFQTGLEGLVVEYMDTVLVAHWQLGLEQTVPSISGEIKSDTGFQTLKVFEDLTALLTEPNPKVYLMDTDGSPYGPVSCTVPNKNTIVLDSPAPTSIFIYDDSHAGPRFCIGRANDFMTEAKILKMVQTGQHLIQIECVEDSPIVYDNETPPSYTPIEPPADSSPIIRNLTAVIYGTQDGSLYVTVTWDSDNCDYHIVDMSEDSGLEWDEVDRPTITTSTFDIPMVNPLHIRVRGVNLFIGKPQTVIINPLDRTFVYPGVYNLRPLYPFNGNKVGVTWDQLETGQYARIKFIHNGVEVKEIDVDESVSFAEITDDEVMAVISETTLGQPFPASGARFSTVHMFGLTADGFGGWDESEEYAELLQTNDPMGDLVDLNVTMYGADMNVDFTWPEPHGGFVFVFASLTPGFTASESNLIHFGDSNTFAIVGKLVHPGSETPNTYYIQIAGCDDWGPDSLSIMPEFTVVTEDRWPPITEDMLDPSLGDRIDLIDRDPAVPGGLVGLVNVNITNISNNRTDIDTLLGYFIDDVLQVVHGGTGVTTATGTDSVVRKISPNLEGVPTAPTPAMADNSQALATTEWVHSQGYSSDPGLGDLPTRVATLESYFTADVLEIAHGGTASTTATGSGQTVLATSPTLGGSPAASTPTVADNSTRIATTEWVKSQGYVFDPEISDLPGRVAILEGYFVTDVLQVVHGGTGVTASTGSGEVVLSNSPDLDGNPTSTTPPLGDSDTSIATTAFVKGQNYLVDADLSSLEQRMTTAEGDIDILEGEMDVVEGDIANLKPRMTTAEGDISTLESYFVAGVLQVVHGGTGVTASTGSGEVVLSFSPDLDGNPTSTTPSLSDNDTSIATTAFVKGQGYATDSDLTLLEGRVTVNEGDIDSLETRMGGAEGDISTIEGYFVAGVLQVIHGGTGVTLSTGTGEVVLSNSPDLDGNATATTQTASNSSTRIATTAFVKNQNYLVDADLTTIENDIATLEGYFTLGVLDVIHGGTGQTLSTGSGNVVLRSNPTVYLSTSSTVGTRPLNDSTTRLANTAFVQQEIADYSEGVDLSSLENRVSANEGDISTLQGYFTAGVLDVAHGGTGVTVSTGTGEVVLSNSPDFDGNATATTQTTTNDSTRIATTAFVHNVVEAAPGFDPSGLQGQIDTNRTDLDVIEGHFLSGVLEVVHGGTGQTTSTGSGSVVLKSSPTLTGTPKAPHPPAADNDTSIATTQWVQGEISSSGFDPSGLQSQIDHNHGDIEIIAGWFGGYGNTPILEVAYGGTGVTSKTGTGSVVLNSNPSLINDATAKTQAVGNNSTRIATTAYVLAAIADQGGSEWLYSSNANGHLLLNLNNNVMIQWGEFNCTGSVTTVQWAANYGAGQVGTIGVSTTWSTSGYSTPSWGINCMMKYKDSTGFQMTHVSCPPEYVFTYVAVGIYDGVS